MIVYEINMIDQDLYTKNPRSGAICFKSTFRSLAVLNCRKIYPEGHLKLCSKVKSSKFNKNLQ